MYYKLSCQKGVGHAFVVHQVSQCLGNFWFAKDWMCGIGGHIHQCSFGVTVNGDVGIPFYTLDLIRGQVT